MWPQPTGHSHTRTCHIILQLVRLLLRCLRLLPRSLQLLLQLIPLRCHHGHRCIHGCLVRTPLCVLILLQARVRAGWAASMCSEGMH